MRKKTMVKFFTILVSAVLFSVYSHSANAVLIRENTLGTETSFNGYWGQSVVTPGIGAWNNLEFNFYSSIGPQAFGNLFLLDQEYLGTPTLLTSSTPGYIADAADAGSIYDFDANVTIQQATQYWFYTDATQSGILIGNTPSGVPGEGHYFASSATSNFNGPFNGVNFTLMGAAAVPEPATMTLLGIGLVGLIGASARRKYKKKVVDKG